MHLLDLGAGDGTRDTVVGVQRDGAWNWSEFLRPFKAACVNAVMANFRTASSPTHMHTQGFTATVLKKVSGLPNQDLLGTHG